MESANVRVDEFAEKNEECKKEPKYYGNFVYIYEGEPRTLHKPEKVVVKNQQPSTVEVLEKITIEHQQITKQWVVGAKLQTNISNHHIEEAELQLETIEEEEKVESTE